MATIRSASDIRKAFLNFFEERGHKIVPSAPIVVKDDPTLMFTNAGMNQFKDYFLGNKPAPFTRAADTQKCLRVSGKHNDLEEVGVDTYHHTMFEMLGNWSFGDYFKKEAIEWSWQLLTEVYGIPKDRLYVTVFEGDSTESLPFDQEAFDEWKKWIAEDRILKGNKKDNFWEMGDTGPCGPCSEIHVDCRTEEERKSLNGASLVNADHPQVIEIWNNVFMEFNRLKDGSLQPLPSKHVDTGMGFERLVRVLQQKQSNYDTDVFAPVLQEIELLTGKKYSGSDDQESIAFRVLADHIRTIVFTIADGQLPAATGAGYVIRRILRRAVRYYYTYLDYQKPLLHQLVGVVAAQFEEIFPEAESQKDFIEKVIREEESSFLKTLEKGIKRFDEYVNALGSEVPVPGLSSITGTTTEDVIELINQQKDRLIDGKFAFELYDTYGFPLDLTLLMAREQNLAVDEAGFAAEMKQQKERSRSATAMDTGDWTILAEGSTTFTGYSHYTEHTRILRYRSVTAKQKQQIQIVLERTPFYPEGGGQVGDSGVLHIGEDIIPILDTKKENDLIIHVAEQLPAQLDGEVVAKVNVGKRQDTARNHTATHLLHAALKQVLGAHVNQKGSLVDSQNLRFDISHFSKVNEEELQQVSQIVNEKIRENISVVIREMPKDEALEMGAMALFGEKYGDVVRTVIIDPKYSVELCGGTHVAHTGSIGTFVIVAESAVAAGVRRIEALTGRAALDYLEDKTHTIKTMADILKTKNVLQAFQKLLDDKSSLEKQVVALEQKALAQQVEPLAAQASATDKGFKLLIAKAEANQMDGLKKLANDVCNKSGDAVIVLYQVINNKPAVAIAISEQQKHTQSLHAGQIIKQHIAARIKGGGGGSQNLATAGGADVAGLSGIETWLRDAILDA